MRKTNRENYPAKTEPYILFPDCESVKDGQGQILFYDGIIQDITELIKAENEIRKLSMRRAKPQHDDYYVYPGEIVYVNPNSWKVTGYTRRK
jgi:PAS domain-containing protein